jgi:hypothetical protein
VAAKSSSDHRVAGQFCCSVVLLAREITSSRSEGGKSSRSTRPRRILKASQSHLQEAASPYRDGVAVALKLGGDLEVAGMVFGGGPQY